MIDGYSSRLNDLIERGLTSAPPCQVALSVSGLFYSPICPDDTDRHTKLQYEPNQVSVGLKTLRRLHAPSGSAILVTHATPTSQSSEAERVKRSCIAQLVYSDEEIPDESCRISSFLANNLGLDTFLHPFLSTASHSHNQTIKIEPISMREWQSHLAHSITLMKVSQPLKQLLSSPLPSSHDKSDATPTPSSSEPSHHNKSIERHFLRGGEGSREWPRFYSPGDLFSVPHLPPKPFLSSTNATSPFNASENDPLFPPSTWSLSHCPFDHSESKSSYYLVTSVEGVKGGADASDVSACHSIHHPYCIDPRTTRVTLLGGQAQALLPPSGIISNLTPTSRPWENVASLIAPLLHSSTLNVDPLRLSLLLLGPEGSGKRTAVKTAASALGLHYISISCYDIGQEGVGAGAVTHDALLAAVSRASSFSPCILLLENLGSLTAADGGRPDGQKQSLAVHSIAEAIRKSVVKYESVKARQNTLIRPKPSLSDSDDTPGLVILMATAESRESIPPEIGRCFTHVLSIDPPCQDEIHAILKNALGPAGEDIDEGRLKACSLQMSGLSTRDLIRGVASDTFAAAAREAISDEEAIEGIKLTTSHIEEALDRVKMRTAAQIGAPEVPNVKWDDVGGLEDVKSTLIDTLELPLKRPELFKGGLRKRSGVLLYGPPGSGKTLLAKAVATQCSSSFISIKGPELINMYIGESERQVREIFARARRAAPCVLFFDELDSLAPARGQSGDSGGVMDRVVSQLLAEIDGVNQQEEGSSGLFVVGATNRPDLLDPSLMRPGRLDKLVFVGIAHEPSSKLKVLSALTRKFKLDDDVDLVVISERCPLQLTGADLYALCADAWMNALKRKIEEGEIEGGFESDPSVSQEDFCQALDFLVPSLSLAELDKYERMRQSFDP